MNPVDSLKAVLCDPDGKCCISGSTEDRRIVDAALEALQAEVKHLNLHLKATQGGRDAALARLAITEEANSMLLARNKWLEHTLEAAGASPVEPSLARAVEPVAPGVKQLAAQLHDDQKWTVEEQQQFAVFLARFPNESSQGIISLGDAWKHGKACATPKATATLLSRATDLHEKAQMSWKEAEALALSEAGVTLSTIDDLIGNSAYRGVDSLLTTPDEIRDFTRAILVHSSNIDALYATPQAAAQPPAPSEAAREYMTGYSDGKEWAGATNQALMEALERMVESVTGVDQVSAVDEARAALTAAKQAQPEPSDLRGIDAGPVAEWVDLVKRGYVSRDECLIAVKDIPLWIAKNSEQAQPERAPLTDAEIEKLREKTFSTNNPFCPVDSKSMRKAVRAAEAAHGIKQGGQHD